ncbi:hypothetical protein SU65_12115 [Flavobacterium psychrophilum]|nr:hypothetical protein SU65_12115 [Flavobacterium psychrophilum]
MLKEKTANLFQSNLNKTIQFRNQKTSQSCEVFWFYNNATFLAKKSLNFFLVSIVSSIEKIIVLSFSSSS